MWVLILNTDGTVKSHQKISDTEGGFTGTLDNGDWFGITVDSLGDLTCVLDPVLDIGGNYVLDDDSPTWP